jgi:replicative DNA helicase
MKDSLKLATRIYLAGDMDVPGQDTMHKIWSELRDKTYLIKWPDNQKDANDAFLKVCDGDTEKFHGLIEDLKSKANESPMPFIYSLKESMINADLTRPMDNPARLRFPWEVVDKWTAILPGDVVCLSASNTGTGKTSLLMQILLENAINHGKIIVNYSAELAPPQYTRRAVACLTGADRENLTKEDFAKAVSILGNAQFYNGYRPKAKYAEVIETLVWAKRRLGADIIAIDHIHFLVRGEKDETKAQADAMRMIKDLAVEFNVIVVVVGQPRKPQSGVKNREMVEYELKGSEAIASDASQVLIMHRDRVEDTTEGNPVFSNITKFKLDKSRESETKVALLWFRGSACKFEMYGGQADGQATPAPPPEDEQGDFFPPGD